MSKRAEEQEEQWQTANGNTVLNIAEAQRSLERAQKALDELVRRDDIDTDQISHLHGLSRSIELLADNFEKSIQSTMEPDESIT